MCFKARFGTFANLLYILMVNKEKVYIFLYIQIFTKLVETL